MNEVKVLDLNNAEVGKLKLPSQFKEDVRPDLIKRAFEAVMSNSRQPYGADPRAGKKYSARLTKRRRKYRGSYGKGISRVPRKILTRRGMQFNWVGAFAPGTVGGRRAFPPVAEKVWKVKINDKERRKAIRSALSASLNKAFASFRNHQVPSDFPFVVSDDFDKLSKTKDVISILNTLGFGDELKRSSRKKIRPGKGKLRGRPYKKAKGLLVVTGNDKSLVLKSAKNIPGIDVVFVKNLNAALLAPGGVPGRIALFTKGAVELIDKEALFV